MGTKRRNEDERINICLCSQSWYVNKQCGEADKKCFSNTNLLFSADLGFITDAFRIY
jgi:hypothetical protein